MPRVAQRPRPTFAAVACVLCVLAPPALASPADDIGALLESPEFSTFRYERIIDTDAGVEAHGLALTRDALGALGLVLPDSTGDAPGTDQPAVIMVDTLHLGHGAIAALFGTDGAQAPASLAFAIEGLRIDLAALADDPGLAMVSRYLGGADSLSGRVEVDLGIDASPIRNIVVIVDLTDVGRFEMALTVHETDGPPSGHMTFVDTDGHGIAGLMALILRAPVEARRRAAAETLASMRAHPSYDPDAHDPVFAMLEEQVAEAEALLARIPDDGPGAAAAMAAWAEEMTTTLPAHAALFEAIKRFADSGGALHLHFAPQDGAAIPMEATFALQLFSEIEAVAAIIEALGITAVYDETG